MNKNELGKRPEEKNRDNKLFNAFKELTDVVVKIDKELKGVKHVRGEAMLNLYGNPVPIDNPSNIIKHTRKYIEVSCISEEGILYDISITKTKKYRVNSYALTWHIKK